MKITESFTLALQNVWGSKMRSFLTMLGIIIGIASVMVIIGLGNGMKGYMTSEFQSMGTNTLSVQITGQGSSRKLAAGQMLQIVEDNPEYFSDMSPTVSVMAPVKVGRETLDQTTVTGVSERYFPIKEYTVSKGRSLRYLDVEKRSHVCVVGSYIDETWYGGEAIGKTIRVGGNVFTIIGVQKQEADKAEEGGADDAIYMPYLTAARLSATQVAAYTVMIVSEDDANQAKKKLENELYDVFGSEDSYVVISMTEILDMMTQMIDVMITILAVIAGISLVVGGIGIMNIMLVSVSERTREIGIRKALGAKERYILTQFVIEAAVISAIGGFIGIASGYGLSSLATVLVSAVLDVPMQVTPTVNSILLAFGASAAIGIVFGYLPARKAAQLNPIDALRYE